MVANICQEIQKPNQSLYEKCLSCDQVPKKLRLGKSLIGSNIYTKFIKVMINLEMK